MFYGIQRKRADGWHAYLKLWFDTEAEARAMLAKIQTTNPTAVLRVIRCEPVE